MLRMARQQKCYCPKKFIKRMKNIENASIEDCMVVKCICNAVTKRAAKLTAAGRYSHNSK